MQVRASLFSKCALVALTLALTGLGCRIPERNGANTNIIGSGDQEAQTEQKVVPRPEDYEERPQPVAEPGELPDTGPSEEVVYLRQVLKNLSVANTYRAEMNVPGPSGTAAMEVFFNRQYGMYGKIFTPGSQNVATEVFIDGVGILYRNEQGEWSDITGTHEARQLNGTFANVVRPPNTAETTIAEDAEVKAKDADGCRRYDIRQYAGEGAYDSFMICASNDLPVRMEFDTPNGKLEIRYFDINGEVRVFKPSVS